MRGYFGFTKFAEGLFWKRFWEVYRQVFSEQESLRFCKMIRIYSKKFRTEKSSEKIPLLETRKRFSIHFMNNKLESK